MKWYDEEVIIGGINYHLNHLQPFDFTIDIPKTPNSAALSFRVFVRFSTHCVTEKTTEGQTEQFNDEGGMVRYFSKERHTFSLLLPDIINGLLEKQCYHTSHGRNYFTIEHIDHESKVRHYHVYFTAKKTSEGVSVFVESAYVPVKPQKQKRKIKGKVILANTFKNKKIARHK